MLYCKKCGNSVAKGVASCSNCGATFNISSQSITLSKKNIVTLVIIVILIIYIVVTFKNSENEKKLKTSQRATIGLLLLIRNLENEYKSANSTYGTIEELVRLKKSELQAKKYGYVFQDLIKKPNANYYAIMASPQNWGKDMDCYYFITNNGIVKKWEEKELPFNLSLPPEQSSIDKIEQLKNVFEPAIIPK